MLGRLGLAGHRKLNKSLLVLKEQIFAHALHTGRSEFLEDCGHGDNPARHLKMPCLQCGRAKSNFTDMGQGYKPFGSYIFL